MLKGIPAILSPQLLATLMEMGHGDEIVIADGNFPAASVASRLIRSDGHGGSELLRAILELLPLDTYAEAPVALMKVVAGDPPDPAIWAEYRRIVEEAEGRQVAIEQVERFAFYERSRRAYAVVATGERATYANVILKKGLVLGQ